MIGCSSFKRGVVQHAVGKVCRGGYPYELGNNKTIEAINYGGKIHFPGNIREPLRIRGICMEISFYKIGNCRTDLSGIGTVFFSVYTESLVCFPS